MKPISNETDAKKPLPRTVWILCWVSFFADVSSEIVYPILPFLAVGAIGMSRGQLGMVEGLAVLLVSLMAAVSGIQSDRHRTSKYGRLFLIRVGYGLPILGKLLIAFATNGWMMAGGRLVDRFGKGLRGAPRDALIADAVDQGERGRAFGLHRALDTAGAMTGVIGAALLIHFLMKTQGSPQEVADHADWTYRSIILLGALLGIASVAITWWIPKPSSTEVGVSSNEKLPSSKALPTSYWRAIGVLCVFSLANSSDTFLLLRATELGFTPVGAVMLYSLYNLVYAGLSYPMGVLSDRLGRKWLMALGWLLYGLVYLGFAVLNQNQSHYIWPLMGLYGFYMALTDGVGKAWIADLAPKESRGKSLGFFYCLTGLCTFFASLLAGIAWDQVGAWLAFMIGSVLAIIAALAMFVHSLIPASRSGAQR